MEKNTIKAAFKKKFFNADGTLNKTVVTSFITLLIVLIQQVLFAFGVSYGGWDQVAAIINTVLTLLGIMGFVEGNGEVTVNGGDKREVSTQETTHQEVSAPQDQQAGTKGK